MIYYVGNYEESALCYENPKKQKKGEEKKKEDRMMWNLLPSSCEIHNTVDMLLKFTVFPYEYIFNMGSIFYIFLSLDVNGLG